MIAGSVRSRASAPSEGTIGRQDEYARIGAILRAAREHLGYSQIRVAAELGVSDGTYSRYESGKQKITIPELQRAAALLGLNLAELLTESEAVRRGRHKPGLGPAGQLDETNGRPPVPVVWEPAASRGPAIYAIGPLGRIEGESDLDEREWATALAAMKMVQEMKARRLARGMGDAEGGAGGDAPPG